MFGLSRKLLVSENNFVWEVGWNLKEVLLLTCLFAANPLGTTQRPPWTDQNILRVHSKDQIIDLKAEICTSCDKWYRERALTHLYHVDNMVRQPEKAKHHHNSQDELLAADLSAELGLPQASQDEDVAGYDDCIRKNEARHGLKGVLKPHLHTGGYKTDVLTMIIAQVSVDMNGSVRTRKTYWI